MQFRPSRIHRRWAALLCMLLCQSANVSADETFRDLPVYAGWAFANAKERPSSDGDKVRLTQENGYAGFMGCPIKSPKNVQAAGSTIPGVYVGVDPVRESYDQIVKRLDRETKGLSKQSCAVWLFFVHRDKETVMDEDRAVDLLKRLAAWSDDSGYKIALYPHSDTEHARYYWTNSTHALKYLQQSGAEQLGLVFTVYHEIRQGREDELETLVDQALPRITQFAVSGPDLIDRSKSEDELYDRLIDKLNRSNYRGGFVIYSRPYREAATQYLPAQKHAFEKLRQAATVSVP